LIVNTTFNPVGELLDVRRDLDLEVALVS